MHKIFICHSQTVTYTTILTEDNLPQLEINCSGWKDYNTDLRCGRLFLRIKQTGVQSPSNINNNDKCKVKPNLIFDTTIQ